MADGAMFLPGKRNRSAESKIRVQVKPEQIRLGRRNFRTPSSVFGYTESEEFYKRLLPNTCATPAASIRRSLCTAKTESQK